MTDAPGTAGDLAGRTFGLVGGLKAFPRRLAAREVERQGGKLLRSVTRATTDVVFGRMLLDRLTESALAARVAAEGASGRPSRSEGGFLRLLGLSARPEAPAVSRQALLDQTALPAETFDLLRLFDAFGTDAEPFSFRDILLARKYAELIAEGIGWKAIVLSAHGTRSAPPPMAHDLVAGPLRSVLVRDRDGAREIDGQLRLDLDAPDDDPDVLFAEAEAAEAAGRTTEAAPLYQRCLLLDPADPVAPFNRANCLRADGHQLEAAQDYIRAIKRDPDFVEAWFNLAGLMSERGRVASAKRYLIKALERDANYADAIYNLATLAYDAGDLTEAGRYWQRYLELDTESDWARRAEQGVRFVAAETRRGGSV